MEHWKDFFGNAKKENGGTVQYEWYDPFEERIEKQIGFFLSQRVLQISKLTESSPHGYF